jgi:hypothetical protein
MKDVNNDNEIVMKIMSNNDNVMKIIMNNEDSNNNGVIIINERQ